MMVSRLKVRNPFSKLLGYVIAPALFLLLLTQPLAARPVVKAKKGNAQPERFLRQTNNYSNMYFYVTNKGVIFNVGGAQAEGLFWPRGSSNSYIFGGGLWFGTKKIISGRRQKLAEIGYNPNSGAGWYGPGEIGDPDNGSNVDSKYITYMSSRYDKYSGSYTGAPSAYVPDVNVHWPLWDTSATKTIKQNFYFGDYVSKVADRDQAALTAQMKGTTKIAAPAMLSQEDIVDFYDDADVSQNPEFLPNHGYPFGLNFQEVIYSWSFGKYRDLLFVRYKATNTSKDTLHECYLAPAFDPDLATSNNDHNSFLSDADSVTTLLNSGLPDVYKHHPSKLNMGYQWSDPEGGNQYGVIGFSFLESPTVDASGQIVDNSDSVGLGGYGPSGLQQLGLKTFQKWTIQNDPSTQDLRYDFMAANTLNTDKNTTGDMRLLLATGPFTLSPGKSVETTVGIGIALADLKTQSKNIDSLLRLMAFAQKVFNNPIGPDSLNPTISHFLSPTPPEVPNLTTHALDKAVLVTWDSASERSVDPLSSKTLPFIGYQLYRTTRSDHDSTIRPDGQNPVIKLGEWALYNFRQDTIFDTKGKVTGFRYTRLNKTPNPIPHSYLDVGDDNHNGTLDGKEGLTNGVRYYYYLLAYDEYDSVNKVGPLSTSIVSPKNFVYEIPTKPPFAGMPDSTQLTTGSSLGCVGNGITAITVDIADTGKFVQLFTNDTVMIKLQPRWSEYAESFGNLPTALAQSPCKIYVDLTDTRQQQVITYDQNYNPLATPPITPYNFSTGLVEYVPGQQADSSFTGRFSSENEAFAPYQLVDLAFRVLVDYSFTQLKAPYRIHSITMQSQADPAVLRLSPRTFHTTGTVDLNNLDSVTNPSFLGSLGEDTYTISFGQSIPFAENDFDTAAKVVYYHDHITDKTTKSTYQPDVLPVTITSQSPCGTLKLIRPGMVNDLTTEYDCRFYSANGCTANKVPSWTDPDSMLVPLPGHFAIDVYHYTDANQTAHTSPAFFTGPDAHTIGNFYFSNRGNGNYDAATQKYHLAVHRIRLAGAEIILNAPGILSAESGDTTPSATQQFNDFAPGDKITIAFSGGAKGLPFPDSTFYIYTAKGKTNYADAKLYDPASVLDQVQVVPNPYIVTHDGQTNTDNAKLYFTRLPPRCTIEIYSTSGDLIKTIEHNGYYANVKPDPNNIGQNITTYDYTQLGDRYSAETWNLLSEGMQRVGSQVLIARIIAKDPTQGDAVIGETTTKFAVVLGGYHIVR